MQFYFETASFPYLIKIVVNQYDGIVTVSDCRTMLHYSLFAGPFDYGRDKTAARPRIRKHLILYYIELYCYTEKFPFQAYIPYPLYPTRLSFLFILALIAPCRTPCRCDFPMRRYSVIRSSSTAPLTGSWMERQPSQIEDDLSFPAVLRCRVGYSVQSPAVSLPFPHFLAVCPACKIYPDKEAGTASDKREEKV